MDQKWLNHSERKSKMAAVAVILKIYFYASSPEKKGQLTKNTVGSIGVTESPTFVILCVLCFKRQSFFTFIVD